MDVTVEDSNGPEFVIASQVSEGFDVMAGDIKLLSICRKNLAGNV